MILTKRQPVSVGEMITEEFMVPLGINQGQIASAMGVSRRTVNELCTGKRSMKKPLLNNYVEKLKHA